jgi:mRNA interferase MazF
VWWVDFGPPLGDGIKKRRPAVIVTNDAANRFLNRVQVVPLTSNTAKLYPGEPQVTVRGAESKAMGVLQPTTRHPRLSDTTRTRAPRFARNPAGARAYPVRCIQGST